ncbi:hypothetical protein B9Z19DRAFT_1134117 [Tuber borchii]|uniref:Uncharacterized protein n=1 Tax=Tuber borchii TaxID=42251 RepID=A0A2T6ZEY7_TUBBO|nr:hypothetical protein B9Z19DRAFT_1134117 [Tuber borchii]
MRHQPQLLLASGQTTLYAREYTHQSLKQSGIPVVWDSIFTIFKGLDLIGVANRQLHLRTNPRSLDLVPGPDFVWPLDGHHKLSMYGIEIYAGIDTYSQYTLHMLQVRLSHNMVQAISRTRHSK